MTTGMTVTGVSIAPDIQARLGKEKERGGWDETCSGTLKASATSRFAPSSPALYVRPGPPTSAGLQTRLSWTPWGPKSEEKNNGSG